LVKKWTYSWCPFFLNPTPLNLLEIPAQVNNILKIWGYRYFSYLLAYPSSSGESTHAAFSIESNQYY
jgi:hypothetical protein